MIVRFAYPRGRGGKGQTMIILGPVSATRPDRLGPRLWSKQVLRPMTLDYQGRTLRFDRPYFTALAQAFNDRAYDAVPFLLADADNRHTMAPERAAGEVIGLRAADDGLHAVIRLTDRAAALVADHPNLGVSACITEDFRRGDGYRAPVALQHVLGTFAPRVNGLSPWTALSADPVTGLELSAVDVIDLTTRGTIMEGLTDQQAQRLTALLDLPEDQFQIMLSGGLDPEDLQFADQLAAEAAEPEGPAEPGEPEPESEEEEEEEGEEGQPQEPEEAPAYVPGPEQTRLFDSSQVLSEPMSPVELSAIERLNAVEAELAASRWESERNRLAAQGVPPAMLDHAAVVLSQPPGRIELSDGPDPAAVIRAILDQARGTVDLSAEIGHARGIDGALDDSDQLDRMCDAAGILGAKGER